jgi:hypothetical protein
MGYKMVMGSLLYSRNGCQTSRSDPSYSIDGYQVCDKWLKDRKERILSLDEIQTYCRIVTAIQKTIEIQKAIDSIYGEVEQAVM